MRRCSGYAKNAVTGGHPALLDDTSGHSSWANSRALATAGITQATPNPEGGIIERNAHGEATGILRAGAADLVRLRGTRGAQMVHA